MSRRTSRSEADALAGLKAGRRVAPKPATSGRSWSLPVTTAAKWVGALVLVLAALDWLGWA